MPVFGPFGPARSRRCSRDTAAVIDAAPDLGPAPCLPCAEKAAAGGAQHHLTAETLSLDTVPWHAPDLSYWRRGGEVHVGRGDDHPEHVLNGSAGTIWLNLDGAMSVRSLIVALHEQTGAPFDVLERDVRAAVIRMAGVGILVVPMEPAPAP
jgi:hypothetical protein